MPGQWRLTQHVPNCAAFNPAGQDISQHLASMQNVINCHVVAPGGLHDHEGATTRTL